MQVSILGAGGFLGRRIADHLALEGRLGEAALSGMTLFDLAAPPVPAGTIPRADVAAVIAALLDEPGTRQQTLELVAGDSPVAAAVRSFS